MTAMKNPTGSPSPYRPSTRPRNPPRKRADDPDPDGDDEPTRIAPRHHELGDDTHDQAEDDPAENAHGSARTTNSRVVAVVPSAEISTL